MPQKHQQIIELLYYSVHSILFHRGVYTKEEFDMTPKFGQTQYIVADFQVRNYIDNFLVQVDEWLESREINHLILIILAKDDGRTLERWTFDISSNATPALVTPAKSTAQLTKQAPKQGIQSIGDIAVPNVLKQVVAATSYLPDLPAPSVFNLQAYVTTGMDDTVLGGGLMDDWRDVTDEGGHPFAEGVETQQTMLRDVKTKDYNVNLLLTALDD